MHDLRLCARYRHCRQDFLIMRGSKYSSLSIGQDTWHLLMRIPSTSGGRTGRTWKSEYAGGNSVPSNTTIPLLMYKRLSTCG